MKTTAILVFSGMIFLRLTSPATSQAPPSYARQVRPFLAKYCIECHNPKGFKAGLDLETYKAIQEGSDRGPVLAAGKPDDSKLVLLAEGKKEPKMPPKKAKRHPQPAEVAVLRAWVAAGAKDDSAQVKASIPNIQPRVAAAAPVAALAYDPAGRLLAAGDYRVVRLLEPAGGKELGRLTSLPGQVTALAFSRSGTRLAVACAKPGTAGEVFLYAVPASGQEWPKPLAIPAHRDAILDMDMSADGKHLAAAGVDKSIRIWQTGTAKGRLVHSVFAHEGSITRLVYAADGQTLYSLGEDGIVKAWTPARMQERKVYARQPEVCLSLTVRPDHKQLALGRYDGKVVLLDEATGKVQVEVAAAKPLPPQPKNLTPASGARGRTLRLVVAGANLAEAGSLEANHAGVTTRIIEQNSTSLQADVTFPGSTPAGVYQLTLAGPGGKSAPLSFTVDLFEPVAETEPNDSPGRSQLVTLPASVHGVIGKAGDVDFYGFSARKGQELGVQVLTGPLGSKLNPFLQLTDRAGKILAESSTGLLGYTFSEAGSYALGVRDQDFRGAAGMHYRLHLGDIPIVTSVFPLGLQRGTEAEIHIGGVHLGTHTVHVRAPADAAPGSTLAVPSSMPALGFKTLVVGEFPEVTATTVAPSQPGLLSVPGTANGIIREAGAADLWRFHARKGERLILEVQAARLGSPLDSFLEILDSRNQPVPRATLRSVAKTYVTFRDHDSAGAGIRIEAWDELAVNDYVYVGNELLRIKDLPPNPDADCAFFSSRGQRIGYLDTTPTHLSNGTPMYKVEVHPAGAVFAPNGFPVISLFYRNDDGGPGLGRDSRIFFDPPADGDYRVRIGDARGFGGNDHAYRLTIRPPRPSFNVSFTPPNPAVARGSAAPITVSADRLDGYGDEVALKLEGLPAGFSAPVTSIPRGENSTVFAIFADPDAMSPAKNVKPFKLIARAAIDGKEVIKEVQGGVPKLIDPGDIITTTQQAEVTVKPGDKVRLTVNIERRNGFKGRVPLEVRGLPHGVRVLDIGLNGILIIEKESRRSIVIYAEPWVQATTRPFVVLARREGKNSEHAARAVLLRVSEK
jgi:hypothetical protein